MKLLQLITLVFLSAFLCIPAHAERVFNDQEVEKWGIDAVMEILTFSHEDSVDAHMQDISYLFTKRGYESYSGAERWSRFFVTAKERAHSFNVSKRENDPLVKNAVSRDENEWVVDVPILLQAKDGKHIRENNFYVKLIIERKETDKDNLGISQFIMAKDYTSPRCWKHEQKSIKAVSKKLQEMGLIKQTLFVKQAEKDPSKVLELMSEDMKKEALYCKEEHMKQNSSN